MSVYNNKDDFDARLSDLIDAAQNNIDDVPIDVLNAINALTHEYNNFLEADILRLIQVAEMLASKNTMH